MATSRKSIGKKLGSFFFFLHEGIWQNTKNYRKNITNCYIRRRRVRSRGVTLQVNTHYKLNIHFSCKFLNEYLFYNTFHKFLT